MADSDDTPQRESLEVRLPRANEVSEFFAQVADPRAREALERHARILKTPVHLALLESPLEPSRIAMIRLDVNTVPSRIIGIFPDDLDDILLTAAMSLCDTYQLENRELTEPATLILFRDWRYEGRSDSGAVTSGNFRIPGLELPEEERALCRPEYLARAASVAPQQIPALGLARVLPVDEQS